MRKEVLNFRVILVLMAYFIIDTILYVSLYKTVNKKIKY